MKRAPFYSIFFFSTLYSTVLSAPSTFNQGLRTDQIIIKRPKGVMYWLDKEIPYTISSLLSKPARKAILQALRVYKKKTCVKFVPRISQENYVAFVPGQGCYSAVGQQGGRQEITISSNCETKGTILHETMHALGFHHEQSRYDREKYVKILWWNIEPGAEDNFEKNSRAEQDTFDLPYDYDSILHYNKNAYSKNNGNTIEAVDHPEMPLGSFDKFSKVDLEKINKVYPCIAYAPKEKCVDLKAKCKAYARYDKSYCSNNPVMKTYCRLSCGYC